MTQGFKELLTFMQGMLKADYIKVKPYELGRALYKLGYTKCITDNMIDAKDSWKTMGVFCEYKEQYNMEIKVVPAYMDVLSEELEHFFKHNQAMKDSVLLSRYNKSVKFANDALDSKKCTSEIGKLNLTVVDFLQIINAYSIPITAKGFANFHRTYARFKYVPRQDRIENGELIIKKSVGKDGREYDIPIITPHGQRQFLKQLSQKKHADNFGFRYVSKYVHKFYDSKTDSI
jgi:hypothetical protein